MNLKFFSKYLHEPQIEFYNSLVGYTVNPIVDTYKVQTTVVNQYEYNFKLC